MTFVGSFQRAAPLTLGELWAWPSMLTLALVENLRRLADEIQRARQARMTADAWLPDGGSGPALPADIHVASMVQLLLRTRCPAHDAEAHLLVFHTGGVVLAAWLAATLVRFTPSRRS